VGLLEGKVALVSGVGEGLGRELALGFAREGADIAAVARRTSVCEETATDVEQLGRRAVALQADITSTDDCERVAQSTIDSLGGIDVLVNVAHLRTDYRTFLDSEPDLANWIPRFEVTFFGTMRMTRACVPHMVERRSGRIIMVNTLSAVSYSPGFASYAASKGALEKATKSLALELGPYGIRVNGVHPGVMWGPAVREVCERRALVEVSNGEYDVPTLAALSAEEHAALVERHRSEVEPLVAAQREQMGGGLPLRYVCDTSEVVGTFVYLASDLSLPVTGQSIHVNMGAWMG
jgi:NAD(P)-dependent dehydrogenase (short-subunit alcohol dehydrogenase family)